MSSEAPSKEPNEPLLYCFPSAEDTSRALADFVIQQQNAAIEKRGKFTIAISGGSLPKILGGKLPERDDAQWDKWEVFFADERVVPLDHPESNYKSVHENLLSKVPIPDSRIHKINDEMVRSIPLPILEGGRSKVESGKLEEIEEKVAEIAEDYRVRLVDVFAGKNSVAFPRFDLILLGTGPDGHTCSLFPGHPLLQEKLEWVAWLDDSPKPPPIRITLTFPVLNHAYNVAFVVTGSGKKDIVAKVFSSTSAESDELPCKMTRPLPPGRVHWFTDAEASETVAKSRRNEFKL